MYVYVENGRGQGTVDTLSLPFSYIAITFWRLKNFPFPVKIIADLLA